MGHTLTELLSGGLGKVTWKRASTGEYTGVVIVSVLLSCTSFKMDITEQRMLDKEEIKPKAAKARSGSHVERGSA